MEAIALYDHYRFRSRELQTTERNLPQPAPGPPKFGGASDNVRIAVLRAAGILKDSRANFVSVNTVLQRNIVLHRELLKRTQRTGN